MAEETVIIPRYDLALITCDSANKKLYVQYILREGVLVRDAQATSDNSLVDPKHPGQQKYWFKAGTQKAQTVLDYTFTEETNKNGGKSPNATIVIS